MDFMKRISNKKLPSFCSGYPWQSGLARMKGEAEKLDLPDPVHLVCVPKRTIIPKMMKTRCVASS